jgi:hypothetical protein
MEQLKYLFRYLEKSIYRNFGFKKLLLVLIQCKISRFERKIIALFFIKNQIVKE